MFLLLVAASPCVAAQQDELIQLVDLGDVLERAEKRQAENQRPLRLQVKFDPKLGQAERIVWKGYAMLRQGYRNEHSIPKPKESGKAIPTFSEEVAARAGMVKTSSAFANGFTEPLRSHISDLGSVIRAGYIREYVWTHHHQEPWQKPDDLKENPFDSWAKKNLAKTHKPLTQVTLTWKLAPKAKRTKIYLDKKAIKSKTDGAIWMHYGLGRFEYLTRYPKKFNAYVGDVVWPGFKEEVHARTHLCDEVNKAETDIDLSAGVRDYLKCLKQVHSKGFMNEYVWKFHSRPNWKRPDDLKEDEFLKWFEDRYPDHKPIQGAALIGM